MDISPHKLPSVIFYIPVACQRKRLAGRTADHHIRLWDPGNINLIDIPANNMISNIFFISLNRIPVIIDCPDHLISF